MPSGMRKTPARGTIIQGALFAVLLLVGTGSATPAKAEKLTIDRIWSDPSLNGPRLRALQFSPDGKRVTFLRGKEDRSNQTDLWEYNIKSGQARMLVDSDAITGGEEKLSHAEILRRTTMRISDQRGIVEYYWSDDGKALLFPLNGDLFYTPVGGKATAPRPLFRTEAFESDARLSPKGRYASFIRDQDIYVFDIRGGTEKRLTTDGKGPIKNGVAEFVAQEEMKRFSGYWWSDDERYIAFTRIDESPLSARARYEINARDAVMIDNERYPSAGTGNVRIRIGVVEVASGKITWLDIGAEEDIYIGRVAWLPDSRTVAIQRQSRDQKVLDLLFADADSGASRLVVHEQSKAWVNLNLAGDMHFLKKQKAFIWPSERSGFKHFYLYDVSGRLIRPLTAGPWVANKLLGVDEEKGLIFFEGNREGPLERHLYSASLKGKGGAVKARRLSDKAGWHSAVMDKTAQSYLDFFSSLDTPPEVSLNRASGKRRAWMIENKLDKSHPFYPYLDDVPEVTFGTLTADNGEALQYRMIRARNFDESRKHPVLVFVYGGPGAQLVTNRWPGDRELWLYTMANRGYVVFTLDNRGSDNRGTAFEAPVYHAMGSIEVADQKRGVEWLAQKPWVDAARVGIFGWSYGGYMTLMSMLKEPATFPVGVAVSPVTDWQLYDTHYTERYMGDPRKVAQAYKASAPLTFADNLKGRLLLVHGLADNNVLPQNSMALTKYWQDHDIAFDMMVYPSKRHGIRGNPTRRHLFRTITRFLDRQLRPVSDR